MYALLPDVAWLAHNYLKALAEVQALVAGRVYTAFPKQVPTAPFVLVQRIGGLPPLPRPLVVDLAVLQLDAYGGRQADAWKLVATCRAALAAWQGEQPNDTGNVCGVIAGPVRYQPDETYKDPRPRYIADFEVTVKPAGAVLAGAA